MAAPQAVAASPPADSGGGSQRAVLAVVLGLAGLVCCPLTAPVGWWLAARELADIRRGLAPETGSTLAQVGVGLGILGTVLGVISVLLACLVVVAAVLVLWWNR